MKWLQRIPLKLQAGPDYGDPHWLANPVEYAPNLPAGRKRALCFRSTGALSPSLRLLIGQTTHCSPLGVSEALNGLVLLVADPARPRPRQGRFRLYVADWAPAPRECGPHVRRARRRGAFSGY